MDELTQEFLIECQDGLARMGRCLTELKDRPQDAGLLAEVFRSVHTVKGTTGFLGFKRLERLAHAGESLLGLLRERKLAADGPTITGLLQLLDGLRAILKIIEEDGVEGDGEDSALIDRMEELQASAKAWPRVCVRAGGARPSLALPCASQGQPTRAASAAMAPVQAFPPVPAQPFVRMPAARASARIAESAGADPDAGRLPHAAIGAAGESTLRVDVTLLDHMMNLVGELVPIRNQVVQAATYDPQLSLLARRLDRVTAHLIESVMEARKQPASNILSKMQRIVRDLSQSIGHQGRRPGESREPERGKSLREAVKDPFTHAVCNAPDGGIEPPDACLAVGTTRRES